MDRPAEVGDQVLVLRANRRHVEAEVIERVDAAWLYVRDRDGQVMLEPAGNCRVKDPEFDRVGAGPGR